MLISSCLCMPAPIAVGLGSKSRRVEESKRRTPRVGRCSLALFVAFCSFGGVVASAQTAVDLITSKHVLIRARIEPDQILVGQKAKLSVDIMTKTWFLEAPAFPDVLDIADAVVIPPGPFGVNSSQVIDGERYAVQTKTYSIISTGVGAYRVPPFEVSLVVAQEDASRSPKIVMTTSELAFEAHVPAEAQGLGLVVSTPRLGVREEWSRSFDDLKVGDSVTRTVTSEIEDSAAMLLPSLEFVAPEGVAVYPARASLEDSRNRGDMSGTRVDRVVYTLEAEGEFDLPEIAIHWWDLEAEKLQREILPAVHFQVAANLDLAVEIFGPEDGEAGVAEPVPTASGSGRTYLLGSVAVLILAVFGWLLRRPIRAVGRAWTELRQTGAEEKERFREFKNAARKGEAVPAVRALLAWLDAFPLEGEPNSLAAFVSSSADPVLEEQIAALESAAFATSGGDDKWSPSELVKRVAAARSRGVRKHDPENSADGLQLLNPRASNETYHRIGSATVSA